MKLLVLNYSMDPRSLVFSHQREVVKRLSLKFEHTFVVTADENTGEKIENVDIFSSNWIRRKAFKNVIHFYQTVLPVVFPHRKNLIVFSHMTEVQSFLIAPLCRVLGIPHFLWYAHKSKSKYLKLSLPFLSGVVTSTPGSCPVKSSKVHPIGQAIDHELFSVTKSFPKNPPLRWYHVGRMDKSKNIDLIIEVFDKLRKAGWSLQLDFYGEPSSNTAKRYFDELKLRYLTNNNSSWLTFHGSVERTRIPQVASQYDGFVHAFQGSLDKAVLEAAMCKRVVVSINPEFEVEFSSTNFTGQTLFDKLALQLLMALEMSEEEQRARIQAFYSIAREHHSLETWINELLEVIRN